MKAFAYIALISLILGVAYFLYDTGYQNGSDSTSLRYEKELKASEQQKEDARIQYESGINAVTSLWLSKKPIERIKYETITKEIIKYVDRDTDCNYSVGAAWLFHAAGQNIGMQESVYSTFIDAEKRETSNIGKADIITACTAWAEEYYSAIDQLHLFQDAVKKLDCVID